MARRAITAVAAVLAVACIDGTGNGDTPRKDATRPEQLMYGIQAPITENGIRRGVLVADSMHVFNDQTRFDFYNGRVDFNTAAGDTSGATKGDRGSYDTRTLVLEWWGNVIVTTSAGDSLRSSHVIYDQKRRSITSDTDYVLVNKGRTVSGRRVLTDLRLNKCQGSCAAAAPDKPPT